MSLQFEVGATFAHAENAFLGVFFCYVAPILPFCSYHHATASIAVALYGSDPWRSFSACPLHALAHCSPPPPASVHLVYSALFTSAPSR